MNGFLTNLLDRHRGVGDIVQPRPCSRFEQDTRPLPVLKAGSGDSDISHEDLEIEQMKAAPLPQRAYESKNQVDPILPRPLKLENQNPITHREKSQSQQPTYETNSGWERDIPRSRDDLPSIWDRVQPSKEPLRLKHDVASATDRRAPRENTNLHPNHEIVSPQIGEGSFQSELSQRIHVLLQRLQTQVESRRDRDTDSNRPAQIPASEITQPPVNKSGREASLVRTVEQEPIGPLGGPRRDSQPIEDHEVNRASLEVGGALQIPAWLSDMQTDFNNRLKEMNAKSEVESVVNVTIGRVEIRAVQAEPVKQPKPQKKQAGVMSLDDYLQQRAYGGQR